MVCKKCGYHELKEVRLFGSSLCRICYTFAPSKLSDFQDYISEKVDWKILDTFRKHGHIPGKKQKEGMSHKAKKGNVMSRAALGYSIVEGKLVQNEDASRVHSLFKTFLERNYSLNSLAKNFGLSVNGLKKVLTNRTYLGEIKFGGQIHKGDHKAIISPDLFYAVQRKLNEKLEK